jgi:hypothetical protein
LGPADWPSAGYCRPRTRLGGQRGAVPGNFWTGAGGEARGQAAAFAEGAAHHHHFQTRPLNRPRRRAGRPRMRPRAAIAGIRCRYTRSRSRAARSGPLPAAAARQRGELGERVGEGGGHRSLLSPPALPPPAPPPPAPTPAPHPRSRGCARPPCRSLPRRAPASCSPPSPGGCADASGLEREEGERAPRRRRPLAPLAPRALSSA